MVYVDYFDGLREYNINLSKIYGEVTIRTLKMCREFSRCSLECCGSVINAMLKSMEDNGGKMTDNIEFFNGFMTGYEKCKKDMESEKKPTEKYTPLPMSAFISFIYR